MNRRISFHLKEATVFLIAWFETNLQLLCYFITDLIAVIKAWTRLHFFPLWNIRAVLECLLPTKKSCLGALSTWPPSELTCLKRTLIQTEEADVSQHFLNEKSYENISSWGICIRKGKAVSFSHSCVGSHADQGISLCRKRVSVRLLKFVYFSTVLTPLVWFRVVSDIIQYCTAFLFWDRRQAF